jgi:uncharacterized small protein (DUF1192 family)
VTQSDQFFILHRQYTLLQEEHAKVLNQLGLSLQSLANQSLEIQILKDEIARLKGTSPRPKLPPNRLEGQGGGSGGNGGGKPGRGKHPRKNKTGLNFHRVIRLKPDNLPEGAKYKDAHKYDIQDIIYQAFNTRYLIERWELPDGTFVNGKLPSQVQGHYGAALRAHVIQLAHSCRVSEELILEQLRSCKIAISAGQLSKMLTEEHDAFHAEKEEILKAALESGQIQTDDVGTRHQAKNCYTNVICGEFFVYLSTTDSKSRINFLKILAQGRNEYRFNQDSLDYLAVHKGAERLIQALTIRNDLVINTQEPEKAFFDEIGYLNATEMRLMIEAGLFASLIEHGVPRDLHIHSDDASQFELFKNSLCWIHEERHYRKLVPAHPEIAIEIEKVRDGIWQLYKDLKVYKETPTELERIRLFQVFDDLFNPKQSSPYQVINDRLALTYAKRDRLLFVLDCPTTPLHNNLSEIGGRGAKVKSKISGGTRSDLGRRAWDTFGSLNLTCRRLGISFYDFLMDRLLGLNKIARLKAIIGERIQSVVTRNAVNDLAIALNIA